MYVDLAGLARYKSDFGAWARGALLPKDAAAARVRTAKAGAVSFVPVQETPLDVSVDFLFSETPPASGDKGPSNPSTISGVSNIHLTRCGKNLLQLKTNYSFPYFDHGITYTDNGDGTYTANGTCPSDGTNDSWLYFSFSGASSTWLYSLPVYASVGKYVISGCSSGGSSSTYMIGTQTHSAACANDFGSGGVLTVSRDEWTNFFIKIMKGQTVSNMKFAPQIEAGEVPTAFEKPEYSNYTIDFGCTYYGGTLDVASGVMTVTHYGYTFTGQETFVYERIGNYYRWSCVSAADGFHGTTDSTCTHYPFGTTPGCIGIAGSGATKIYFVVTSGAASPASFLAEQYAAGTPVIFVTKLPTAEQYTVSLTPTQILSLTQSSDYDPRVNTVYADAQAVQVGYLKHPSAASADLRGALVSLGGGV